ncbi:carbohydrate sulfotransferase 8-like [Tigriopus californicus]|uniref:carbohydrate sulfotransferase 8-like n=1 Tax=Tigriopus californicus TaxID=6832 RepID=UPI0027D9D041|nr:carbohydrate sulfotransferase 8-like [Tigriopus californicus]
MGPMAKKFRMLILVSVSLISGAFFAWPLSFRTISRPDLSERLNHHCSQLSQNHSFSMSQKALERNFIWDRTRGVAYCKIPKAGTTFWIQNFARFSGVPKTILERLGQDELHLLMKHVYRLPKILDTLDQVAILSQTYSFTFVRHPMIRLASTYQDKVLDASDIKQYKGWSKLGSETGRPPSFGEFIDYILSNSVESEDDLDTHIRPYWKQCGFCSIKYDFIGKVENLDQDMKLLLAQIGLDSVIQSKQVHSSSGGSTDQLAQKYFRELNSSQKTRLYEMYRIDCHLVEYNCKQFLFTDD